jgi:hypothetical protein
MPNTKKIWRFAISLSKNPFPSHPAPPASPKNPANNLSDTEHQNPKNVHFLKFAHEKTSCVNWPPTTASNPHRQKRPSKIPVFLEKTAHRLPPNQKISRNPENSTMDVREQFAIPEDFKVFPRNFSPHKKK